jgi:hypothetical protein
LAIAAIWIGRNCSQPLSRMNFRIGSESKSNDIIILQCCLKKLH